MGLLPLKAPHCGVQGHQLKNFAVFCQPKQWSAQMTTKTVLASGKVSVNGGADLKGSQAYTCEFGMATLSMWLEEGTLETPDLSKAQIPDFWKYLPKKDRWDDAKVAEVLQYLSLS